MREHGLQFCSEMVLAFLEHRKTMTRRTQGLEKINENPDEWELSTTEPEDGYWLFRNKATLAIEAVKCPYAVGDRVYAKEGLYHAPFSSGGSAIGGYVADYSKVEGMREWRWKRKTLPSMFMPKWAARIWRPITAIRCERLQQISEADILREGCPQIEASTGLRIQWFKLLWQRLNGKKHPWASNCWVFAYSLKEK